MAYTDYSTVLYKATVMKYTGAGVTGWVPVGSTSFSGNTAEYLSLALDSSNTPYVAYQDWDTLKPKQAVAMKYTGAGVIGWAPLGSPTGISAGEAYHISLALDKGNTPYMSYEDVGTGSKATVLVYTGAAGTGWVPVGSAGFSAAGVTYTSLALDSSGALYVAYTDYSTVLYKATVMKYTGAGVTGWVPVGSTSFSGNTAEYISLALDSSNTPFVAYQDWDTLKPMQAVAMKYTGKGVTGWAPLRSPTGISAGEAYRISLALDKNNTPSMSYEDVGTGSKATVLVYTGAAGTGWAPVGSAGLSTGGVTYTSLALDSSSTLYLAYTDYDKGQKTTVMKLVLPPLSKFYIPFVSR